MTLHPFALAVTERAVKTAAQAATAALLASEASTAWAVDWHHLLGVALLAALLSVLTSLGSAGVGQHGPSLGDWETVNRQGQPPPGTAPLPGQRPPADE